jgi:MFS family permease
MNSFQLALLIGALATGALSWQLERAWLWIAAGAASFIASTAYARYGLPMPPLFTALCDAAVCLLIYGLARQMWEVRLYQCFLASVLVSIVFLALSIFTPEAASRYLYVTLLEAINWAALLLIAGTALMQWIGDHGGYPDLSSGRHVRWVDRALFAPRQAHRWWQN